MSASIRPMSASSAAGHTSSRLGALVMQYSGWVLLVLLLSSAVLTVLGRYASAPSATRVASATADERPLLTPDR